MADTKISALTAVVTPAATDEFAVNQGSVSKKVTRLQNLTLEAGEQFLGDSADVAGAPSFSFAGDPNTGMYNFQPDKIGFALGGVSRFTMGNTTFTTGSSNGPGFESANATATTPTLKPRNGDVDTGIGHHSLDNLSIVSGGLEAARFEDPADLAATETSLWLYDLDNATMEQVTVGAPDSGGAGFKVLRIAN